MNPTLIGHINEAIDNEDYKLLKAVMRKCRELGLTAINLNASKREMIAEAVELLERTPDPQPQPVDVTFVDSDDHIFAILKRTALGRGYAEAEAEMIARKILESRGNPEAYAKAYKLYISRIAA